MPPCLMKKKKTQKESKLIKCIKEKPKMITLCTPLIVRVAHPVRPTAASLSFLPFRLELHKGKEKELIKAPFEFSD